MMNVPRSLFGDAIGLQRADPTLHGRFDALAAELGLSEVDLYVVNEEIPNAIPLRDQVAITSGLMDRVDDETLEVVILHTLAHIKLGHDRGMAGRIIGLIFFIFAIVQLPLSPGRRGALLFAAAGVGTVWLTFRSRRYVEAADRIVIDQLESPEPLARAIIALQSGRYYAEPSTYSPPSQSRLTRVLGFYPPTDRRLSSIYKHESGSAGTAW